MGRRCGAVLLVAAALLAGCHDDDAPDLSGGLPSYDEGGDGCARVVAAVSAAEPLLQPLGAEQAQAFGADVRGRLQAVADVVAASSGQWPSARVDAVASDVGVLAEAAAEPATTPREELEQVRALLRYRTEAARLVLTCLDEAAAD